MANWIVRIGLFIAVGCCTPSSPVAAVVLQYHHIDDDTPALTSVTPGLFAQQMAYLHENQFDVWPLDRLMQALDQNETLPERVVAISFDDGYASVLHQALPILRRYDFPFTVFINPQLVGSNPDYLSWAELNDLQRQRALIANHTLDHPHLLRRESNESESAWRQRVRWQIEQAEQQIINQLGQSPALLAYPYGEYNEQIKQLVADLGLVAFAQHSGAFDASVDRQAVPRFPFGGSYGDMPDFISKVNTLALPMDEVRLYADEQSLHPLVDPLLPQEVDRPLLEIRLSSAALARSVSCFASGQGALAIEVDGERIRTRPRNALPTGRSRINCTAPSGQPGRYYWYSHFLIRKLPDGSWYGEY